MLGKNVRIRIVTKIDANSVDADARIDEVSRYTSDVTESRVSDEDVASLPLLNGVTESAEGPIMSEVKGTLAKENGQLTLSFATHLVGSFPSFVTYKFDEDNRDTLAVIRKSIGERVYYFSNECKRQTVVCEAEGAAFEISIYTKSLKNKLTFENGGYIELEYFAEMRGGVIEHCKEYLICEPIK
jgi:hypothetical protein